MTSRPRILRRGSDPGLSTRFMSRPNEGEGELMAHLLLLPGIERGMPASRRQQARLRADIGYAEPAAAIAAAGSEIRSASHLLAMHCVHCLARPLRETRPFRGTPAFRALHRHAVGALLESGRLQAARDAREEGSR